MSPSWQVHSCSPSMLSLLAGVDSRHGHPAWHCGPAPEHSSCPLPGSYLHWVTDTKAQRREALLRLACQATQAASGLAQSDGAIYKPICHCPSRGTTVNRFYRTIPCTEQFRQSKFLQTLWRHNPDTITS
eukprot:1137212-Pelagomonas_calceolata.AAC.6